MRYLLFLIASIAVSHACEHGDIIKIGVLAPDDQRYDANIDRCIVPIVQALNNAGIPTVTSCCGHFLRDDIPGLPGSWGYILLENRLMLISPVDTRENAVRLYDKLAEPIGHTWDRVTEMAK
jgi:sugar phosphate isomerase/epimerase